MADMNEIKRIAADAARAALGEQDVLDVEIESLLGMDVDELFRLRIVVPDQQLESILADQFIVAVLGIKAAVRDSGETRRAMVGLTTPSEQALDGDPGR